MTWLEEKVVELRGQFYRWLFAKAFPNISVLTVTTAKFGPYEEQADIETYLYAKPVNLLVRRDIESMTASVYRRRYPDPEFRSKVDELCR